MKHAFFTMAIAITIMAQGQKDSTHWKIVTDDFTGEMKTQGVHHQWIPVASGKELGFGIGIVQPTTYKSAYSGTIDTLFSFFYIEPKWLCIDGGSIMLIHANGQKTNAETDEFNCDGMIQFSPLVNHNLKTSPVVKIRVTGNDASKSRDIHVPKKFQRMWIQALKNVKQ